MIENYKMERQRRINYLSPYTYHQTRIVQHKYNNINEIIIQVMINEAYAITKVIQFYENKSNDNVELSLEFPISQKIVIRRMKATMNDKIIMSKIFEKNKAIEKYTDSISSGNVAILGQENVTNPKLFEVKIGNLQPGEKLEVETELMQSLSSSDLSYEYSFNLYKIPNLIEYKYHTTIRTITDSNIPNLIPNPRYRCFGYYNYSKVSTKFESNVFNVPVNFSAVISTTSNLTRVSSPNYDVPAIFLDESSKNSVVIDISNELIVNNKFSRIKFYIRHEGLNKPQLYEQYDPKLKEYSYNFSFLQEKRDIPIPKTVDFDNKISYYEKYESDSINDAPGVFYFLIDQSGSMKGNPLELAKNSLKLFLKSLPKGSYFDIIGFGSKFKNYFMNPQEYNGVSLTKANKIIDSLQADLGGTNIFEPLNYILSKKPKEKIDKSDKKKEIKKVKIESDNNNKNFTFQPSTNKPSIFDNIDKKLSRSVFLLTDGQVGNSDVIINLIQNHIKRFRFHSIGIGSGVSKKFIREVGETGKGSFHIAKDLLTLPGMVIKALNQALMPYYNNIKLGFENEALIEYPKKENISLLNQDEIFQYSFITNKKIDNNLNITFSAYNISNKKVINGNYVASDILFALHDGNELNQVISGLELKNNIANMNYNSALDMSKKYQVLCKYTALFMEIENDKINNSGLKNVFIPVNQLFPQNLYNNNTNNLCNYQYRNSAINNYSSNATKSCNIMDKDKLR